jgi:alkanesulfonate monooxygenase SsuD/methylene tetrahydromethanopterin reductase-like flavin-dependent oxidoreductase (luciferase family)
MNRIGIAISGGPNPAKIVDLVVLAESLGYGRAWVAEGHGGDQFAILAASAARRSRILLGASISSVFVRTAPTIAMAASTVADIRRPLHSRARAKPQSASRARARSRVWEAADAHP